MSCRLGLSIGDAIAEVSLAGATGAEASRWFFSKKNLADGLRDAMKPWLAEGGELQVATALPESLLNKRLGSAPAFLVTAGFENWLTLRQPILPGWYAAEPKRAWSPVSEDTIFGISERVDAAGQVETPLPVDELQFLLSKLQLLKIKTVAIGFLHARKNPEHERQAARFLRENGFEVFCSHEGPDVGDELSRWWAAILAAFMKPALDDHAAQITAALGEHREKWRVRYWAGFAGGAALEEKPGFASLNGLSQALHAQLGARPNRPEFALHFGLEQFQLLRLGAQNEWNHETLPARLPIKSSTRLAVQPLQGLTSGLWPVPIVAGPSRGYEPGPMIFGKSLHPTLMDILFLRERLRPVDGFSALINDKTRGRILEALFTLGKSIPSSQSVEATRLAEDIETAAVEKIISQIQAKGVTGGALLSGALAATFEPLLKARRPDWKWTLIEGAEWAEALAAAGNGESAR